MSTFNLKSYLKKQSSYEGAQGYFSAQSRAWCNCFKNKIEANKRPQEAWQDCLKEYNADAGNSTWALKYAGESGKIYKSADSDTQTYKEIIQENIESGMPIKLAIFKALNYFFSETK
jgi:hypothetical protein